MIYIYICIYNIYIYIYICKYVFIYMTECISTNAYMLFSSADSADAAGHLNDDEHRHARHGKQMSQI